MRKLVLLGYAHNDRLQVERAQRAFAKLAPSAITLELDTNHQDARQIPIMDAAIKYARGHGISVHDVDKGFALRAKDLAIASWANLIFSMGVISPLVEEYISKYGSFDAIPREIRAKLLANPHLDLEKHGIELGPDILYDIYRKYGSGSISPDEFRAYLQGYGIPASYPSEVLMADAICRIFKGNSYGLALHVGGLFHMLEIGTDLTLYRILSLRGLNPERVLLADF